MRPSPEIIAWLGVVAIAACGTADDVFSSGEGDVGTGGTSTTTSSGTTSSSSSSGTTSSSSSSGTTSSSSSSSSGSSSSSSGSSSSSSSSSGGTIPEVPCGNEVCFGGDVCCIPYQGDVLHCAIPGDCGNNALEVGCNGPADCPGSQVCCGHYNQQMGYIDISCANDCNDNPQSIGIIMCGDDPDACEPGETCNPSGFLPDGHAYCN